MTDTLLHFATVLLAVVVLFAVLKALARAVVRSMRVDVPRRTEIRQRMEKLNAEWPIHAPHYRLERIDTAPEDSFLPASTQERLARQIDEIEG